MLSGPYNFRHVTYTVGDQAGDLSHATALWGTITFTGKGTYTLMGTCLDSNTGQTTAVSIMNGAYSISASGWGFLNNPVSSGDVIWGLATQNHLFIGSSTETQNAFNDLFIGALAASNNPTDSSLQGSYSAAYMNFPNGFVGDVVTAGFQMEPNGDGQIGSVNIQMFTGASSNAMDVVEPASYSFSGGIGTLTFPTIGYAIAGPKILYTPDGKFVFGGGMNAFDFFVGVLTQSQQTSTTTPPGFGATGFAGLFYQAGMDEIMPSAATAPLVGSLQTYYGAFEAVSGAILDQQRILAPLGSTFQGPLNPPPPTGCANSPFNIFCPYQPFSYTYVDQYSLGFSSNIGYSDTATNRQYVLSSDGAMRLGFGQYPNLGFSVAAKAPAAATASSSSNCPASPAAYIYPTGIVNGASFAPFTAGIAPGELLTIFGQNFLPGATVTFTQTGNTLPPASATTVVSANQLTVMAPTGLTSGSATVSVTNPSSMTNSNQSTPSCSISVPVIPTDVGIVTQASDGIGAAAAYHSNGTAVSPASPATVGETITLYVTGLGGVTESFDGVVPTPVATPFTVTIGGIAATYTTPASASTSSGAVAMSVTVPKGVSGVVPVMIATGSSSTQQATIAVTAAAASSGGGSSTGSTTGSGSGSTGASTSTGGVTITINIQ
jgi:uncharacterized protein (TIGR03437 family)